MAFFPKAEVAREETYACRAKMVDEALRFVGQAITDAVGEGKFRTSVVLKGFEEAREATAHLRGSGYRAQQRGTTVMVSWAFPKE